MDPTIDIIMAKQQSLHYVSGVLESPILFTRQAPLNSSEDELEDSHADEDEEAEDSHADIHQQPVP